MYLAQENNPSLIEALKNPTLYDHPVEKIEIVETHISWILLTGPYAYKIKKPVNLGFVDFSTLEKRYFYCQEELRLNRRLAASLYLDLIKITGNARHPELNGKGPVIEYAVKMKQFDRNMELDRVLERDELSAEQFDVLAKEVAEFHRQAEVSGKGSPFGTPELIAQPMRDNFAHIHGFVKDREELAQVNRLKEWTETNLSANRDKFLARKSSGFIRECHGDLHLANMVLIDRHVVIFDCLEFNENLRFIDVMSDLAFLLMDLDDRAHSSLGNRFLNAYLEASGDYDGLSVLRTYKMYRAMVRAKVAAIRLSQKDLEPAETERLRQEHRSYFHLAESYIQPIKNFMMVTYGFSGAGKSVLTQQIAEISGAIRIRTDVERKRIAGLSSAVKTSSFVSEGIYSPEMTRRTYQRIGEIGGDLLRTGYSVILDGTFLHREQREAMHEVARRIDTPFIILEVYAPEADLQKRITQRIQERKDPSEANLAVLDWQIKSAEPLMPEERPYVLRVNTGLTVVAENVMKELKRIISAETFKPL